MADAVEREGHFMQNDAKFGLLAGVIGVVVVAVMSANRPPDASNPNAGAKAEPVAAKQADEAKPAVAVALTPEPTTTPVIRTRKELDGTSTSRGKDDDIDQ